MPELPNLDHLSHAEKDGLIRALWQRLEAAERRIAELEARLAEPGKTPDNSSLPPSKGQKPNQPEKTKRAGPRQGSPWRRSSAGAASRRNGHREGALLHALPGYADRGRSGAARLYDRSTCLRCAL